MEVESKLLLDRGIRTDEFLEIPATPAGGWIWAEINVRRTLAGPLLDLLYRNQKMLLQVETNRRLLDFRFLDETAAIGFCFRPMRTVLHRCGRCSNQRAGSCWRKR
jgi:hypothetical protein